MLLPNYHLSGDFMQYEELVKKHGAMRKFFSKGTVLYGATAHRHMSYYIASGITKLSVINEDGREVIICFYGKGSIYPINCMEDSFIYEDYMQLIAVTDLEVLEFPAERIVDMSKEESALIPAIVNRYGKYSILLVSKILMSTYNDSVQLLSSFLYLYARQQNSTVINLTQEDLAKLTGISLSHATRAITTLRNEGLLSTHRGKMKILNLQGMKRYCGAIGDAADT